MTQQSALTLSVGVTGHRLNKLDSGEVARLRGELRKALAELRRGISDIPGRDDGEAISPKLRVISPLAEGADRIVAETALEQGAELVALLPFARDDYAQDFDGQQSRAEFASLLDRASEVVEMDRPSSGDEDRKAAYSEVGAQVVERSDMLIALWDGQQANGIGGTADVVKLAADRGCPVFWLPTAGAGRAGQAMAPRLLLPGGAASDDATDSFVAVARSILAQQPSPK